MELLGSAGIEDVAGLLERRKRIRVEHLRPQIAVIGGGVAVAREYVLEVGGPVAHDDLVRHADARKRGLLETADVEDLIGLGPNMDVEIDKGRGDVFHGRLALVEGARRDEATQLILGHRLPGAIVAREPAQDLRPLQPVLVELRRQLRPILEHTGPRDHRVGDVGEKRVQCVSEFVEQSLRVVE